MPHWVQEGFSEYQKRLPNNYQLILKEIPAEKRLKNPDLQSLMEKESEKLLASCPPHSFKIALDRQGKTISSPQLAQSLQNWHDESQDIAILVGGPEGISAPILSKTDQIWSLSELTLPHPLVRVLVAEQIYRAFSILSNHPYHR